MRLVLLAIAAAIALSGCVLHESTPLFTDADATLALGTKPLNFAVYELKDEGWVPTSELPSPATITGNHYVVTEPVADNEAPLFDEYYFITLDPTHYLIQANAKGEADYAGATWDGTTLLVSLLDCAVLKTHLATNLLVVFEDDSCSLQPSKLPPKELLAKLLPVLPPPTLRFVVK